MATLAERISSLRRVLKLSRREFGRKLGHSAQIVSRWECGTLLPSADSYIRLGNIAGETDCWFFWGKAGVRPSEMTNVFPEVKAKNVGYSQSPPLHVVLAGYGKKIAKAQIVAIPVLKARIGSHAKGGDRVSDLHQAKVEHVIAAPSQMCPNPAHTTCLRVKGDSMSPLINDGAIVAVDCAQQDWAILDGKIIVVLHKARGLSISRLRKYGDVSVLESENRLHQSTTIRSGFKEWQLVGRVLWWVGMAP
jgi:phage repressor protein C with HTH and peptisase S24 domain